MKRLLLLILALGSLSALSHAEKLLGSLPSPAPGEGIRIENNGGSLKVYSYKLKAGKAAATAKEEAPAGADTKPAKPVAPKAGGQEAGTSISDSIFDKPIASAAAFIALDVSPETISKPTTPRDFAASVLNGVDKDGKLQTGFALETTPFRFLMKDGLSLKEYQANYTKRLFYNTVLSIATTKASENGKEVRLAAGLNFTLLDTTEKQLLRNLKIAHDNAFRGTGGHPITSMPRGLTPAEQDDWIAKHRARYGDPNTRYKKDREDALAMHYDGYKVTAAMVPLWLSREGNASTLSGDGWAFFGTGSYLFHLDKEPGSSGGRINELEFLVHARYRQGESVADPTSALLRFNQDTLLLGGGLRFGDHDLWHAQVEASYKRIWHGPGGDSDILRVGGGFERRVAKNLWFVIQVGNEFGGNRKNEQFYSLGSFRFGSGEDPIYANPKFE